LIIDLFIGGGRLWHFNWCFWVYWKPLILDTLISYDVIKMNVHGHFHSK